MEDPDDVPSPFRWLDTDGTWNDLLSMIFSGTAWPEGSETAVWDLAKEWVDLAQGLADSSDLLQTAAADLLAAWDAPAAGTFDDLARQLLGSPDVGLPGHVRNASAVAQQVSGFGVDLQYAKVSVNIAVAVAAVAVVIAIVLAPVGGLSLTTLGPAAQAARQAVLRALGQLASAAGRRAVVQDMGRAVADAAVAGAHRVAGHHLVHEVAEEVLEELVIDVGTQTYQVADGTRTDWNRLSTVMAGIGGGVGGAVGAGVVAPVFARVRSTAPITAVAGLGAGGRYSARVGNFGIRHTGGLVTTASTNVIASPAGGVAASLLTGQGFPLLDGSSFGTAALGALGRYRTVSPTNPAVLSAAVHPVQALTRVHLDALAGHTAQRWTDMVSTTVDEGPAVASVRTTAVGTAGLATATPGTSSGASSGTTSTAPPADPHPAGATSPSAHPADVRPSAGTADGSARASAHAEPTSVQTTGGRAPTDPTPPVGPAATSPDPTPRVGPAVASPDLTPRVGPAVAAPDLAGPSTGQPRIDVPPAVAPMPAPTDPGGSAQPGTTGSGAADLRAAGPTAPHSGVRSGIADPAADPGGPAAQGTSALHGDPGAGSSDSSRSPTSTDEPAGPASADDPPGPPSPEQELYDGMPEPLRRYLMEAVAHGQVWADLVQDQLVEVVGHLAEQGLPVPEAVGLANAVKSMESAARKIQPPIQGGSTFASAIWSMDDLVRFSLQIDPEHYGTSVLQALEVFRALGWSVPAVPTDGETHDDWRNTWAIGNRHHGLLVVMTHGVTGQRVEMQFPTPQSWAVGKRTHALYEVFRMPESGPLRRVAALADILEIVRAESVESHMPTGLGRLGKPRENGAARIFDKEVALAAQFFALAEDKGRSPESFLTSRGTNAEVAGEIVKAAADALQRDNRKGENDDGSRSSGLADLGTVEGGGPAAAGSDGPGPSGSGPTTGAAPRVAPRGPGSGAPRPARQTGSGPRTASEGLRVHGRDLEEAGHPAGPGPAGRPGSVGDGAVRRAGSDLDLGPDERGRDDGSGSLRRGPLHPRGASHPRAGGSSGSVEGDNPADTGAAAGDLPEPGGQGVRDVGDPGGPGEAARPAALTGPLAVGADAAVALKHVLDRTQPVRMWEGADGVLPGQVLLLADGSSVRINTGPNPWARTDPDRPLQMWTIGAFHLDDGPLTPAASAFLVDLERALQETVGGPSSHWLAQRATLDPGTHVITEPGVARPRTPDGPVLVWDAAQGWVDATRAGGLARVVDEGLIPPTDLTQDVVDGAARVVDLLHRTERAEALAHAPGTPEHHAAVEARAHRRADLRRESGTWVAASVEPALQAFTDQDVTTLTGVNGRLLVELDHGALAVVVVAEAENDVLSGSRPGLQQEGTTTDLGQLRNELAAYPENDAHVTALTRALQQGAVRHFRVQGVLADDGFVGMRVTEFEVIRPAQDRPGVLRSEVEPHRHVDPGLATREALQRVVAGSASDALRWLPLVNPHRGTAWSTNCGECSRDVADLVQGRGVRAAFGDNGARVLDDDTGPGELHEMWRYAGITGSWHPADADPDARIGAALAARPAGTVAIVLVNWAGVEGGHWFNAVVTEDGVEWIDGQSAQHHAWPPQYPTPYSGYSVITRAPGSETWADLFARGS